jgi:hypothetical protein
MHLHHSVPRSRGGTYRDLVPMMWDCHSAGHTMGWKTFQQRRGCELEWEAARLWLRWQAFVAARPTMGPRKV